MKFKVAGNFQKKFSSDDDNKYFGLKKASRINLISNREKSIKNVFKKKIKKSIPSSNFSNPRPRFSHSPSRTQKHNFILHPESQNSPLKKEEILNKNSQTKRIVIQRTGDSLGSAPTNIWSSNSPRSLQNETNRVSLNSLNNGGINAVSLQENFFSKFLKKTILEI